VNLFLAFRLAGSGLRQRPKGEAMGLIEKSILSRMNNLGLSRAILSNLCGLREQYLCPALRCSIPLLNDDAEKIHRVLADLEKLQDLSRPWELPIQNIRKLKLLLERLHDGDLETVQSPVARQISEEMLVAL
jgi:hypothetical protein